MFEHTAIQLHNAFPFTVMKIFHSAGIDETGNIKLFIKER